MRAAKPIALVITTAITMHSVAPSVGASIARQPSAAHCDFRFERDLGPPEGCDTGSAPPKASAFQLSGSSTTGNLDITMISGRSFYTVDEAIIVDAITDADYFVRLGDQKITRLTPPST